MGNRENTNVSRLYDIFTKKAKSSRIQLKNPLRKQTYRPMPIIALLSDFGYSDWYVASMKGVIHSIAEEANIVDINHQIPPGEVSAGAFVLSQCHRDFPEGSIVVAVVDPGVGTSRDRIIVSAAGLYFVGPDNGLFGFLAAEPQSSSIDIRSIKNADLMSKSISSTFHGRDIFAPAAAHLANGTPLNQFGPRKNSLSTLERPKLSFQGHRIVGQVIYIDNFGNAISNIEIPAGEKEEYLLPIEVKLGPLRIPYVRTFQDVQTGQALAYLGSGGFLEIATNGGSAAESLPIRLGDEVTVRQRR